MTPELSHTMAAALAMAHDHSGRLDRFIGGRWSWRGVPRDHNGNPIEHFGTSTIEGVVSRGRLEYSEWKDGRCGRFPVVAIIKPEAA